MSIPQWIVDLIPLEFAQKNNVLPFFCYDKSKILSVVIADPQDKQLPQQIKNVSGYHEIERYIALEATIKAGIAKFYNKEAGPFEQLKTVIKPETPQTIASFVPRNDTIRNDTVFGDSEKPGLKPKATPPPATEENQRRRLSDHILSLSVMSDDTFIEVLNVVINVLEIYKGQAYRGHSASVAKLVKEISQTLGLKATETYHHVLAAYLHDCCMHAPEHLTLLHFNTKEKLELLEKYSRYSERLFEETRLPGEVYKIFLHTFERYDGEGYPDNLKGENIPLGSRIIAAVDAFVHLLNFESHGDDFQNLYKSSFETITSLKEKYFDPEIVDILEKIVLDLFIDEASPRVIILDPDAGELEPLSLLLKRNGIFSYPLQDTEKVLAFLDDNPVGLIVSEINTKPLDGFSVCNLVRTNDKYRNVHFVFLSEKPDSAMVSKGFEAGADDFITKPYNPDILVAKIQNFIKQSIHKTEERAKSASTKKGITGNLAEIHVNDLIQMLYSGRKTGVLKLFKDDESGEVFFDQGQVINARYKQSSGVDAFNLLVRWEHGLFILDPDAKLLKPEISDSTEMLLLEAFRVWDEEKQGAL